MPDPQTGAVAVSGAKIQDGVGMIARGDAVTVFYAADATLERSRWLFETFDKIQPAVGSTVVLLVVGDGARPPDQAAREHDAAAYTRLAPRLRRLAIVAEGGGFRNSLVRLVFTAYATMTGKGKMFVFAKDLQEALSKLQQVASPSTPAPRELNADVATLREALGASARPLASKGPSRSK